MHVEFEMEKKLGELNEILAQLRNDNCSLQEKLTKESAEKMVRLLFMQLSLT